jgi:hypothetical protein
VRWRWFCKVFDPEAPHRRRAGSEQADQAICGSAGDRGLRSLLTIIEQRDDVVPDSHGDDHVPGPTPVHTSGRFLLDGVLVPSRIAGNGFVRSLAADITSALAIHADDDAEDIIIRPALASNRAG